jgi:thiol-disulfide isomerase/thioredoxin
MTSSSKKTLVALTLVLLLAAAATYYFLSYSPNHSINKETLSVFSNPEGELPYTDLEGNPVSLDKYLGRILVVVSWASWSPFSKDDLLMLSELSKNYDAEKVVFMAINRKETKEQAARYINTIPEITGLVVALDPRDNFYAAVGGYAMPEAVIYSKYGEIIDHQRGVANKEQIVGVIDGVIEKD